MIPRDLIGERTVWCPAVEGDRIRTRQLLSGLPDRSAWNLNLSIGALSWLLLGMVSTADADVIRCSFTEPFAVTTYSSNTGELDVSFDVETSRSKSYKNVSLQIMGPGLFELWGEDEQVVQRLELTYEGSDGMSDFFYPYSVHWITEDLYGGCTSNHQDRKLVPTR